MQTYDELDPIAQMNVDADYLATQKLQEFGIEHVSVPFDPTSKVMLKIGG